MVEVYISGQKLTAEKRANRLQTFIPLQCQRRVHTSASHNAETVNSTHRHEDHACRLRVPLHRRLAAVLLESFMLVQAAH